MSQRRAVLSALVGAFVSAGLIGMPGSGVAHGAGAHRAMVVVDTGATTYQKVITFDGDSVTGIQALALAGAEPVVYSFSGQGGAVCRLFGIGRDAGPNCLGGADGDNRYWAYFRAPSGTSSFTYSRAGGGSTQVHDGDVEGWKFGTGAAPAWSPVPVEPATTTTTATPPPPPNPPPAGGPVGVAPTGTAPILAPDATPEQIAAFYAALGSTTTTTVVPGTAEVRANRAARGATRRVAAGRVAGRTDSPASNGDGGSAGSLALFALVAVALGGGGMLLRRSRRRVA